MVAYALAGRMDVDMIESSRSRADVYLRDIWPSREEVNEAMEQAIESDMFRKSYGEVFEGDETWNALAVPEGDRYAWDPDSTYVQPAALLRGHAGRSARRLRGDRGRPRAGRARRQRDHRPHLAGRRDQEGLARPAST